MKPHAAIRWLYNSRLVESLISSIAVTMLRRKHPPAANGNTAVALMFPAERGSVGDEAMALATLAQLRSSGCKRVALIAFSSKDDWRGFGDFDEIKIRPSGWPLRWFGFCRWLAQYDALGVIGADALDGYYSPSSSRARLYVCQMARRLGLRSILLGFSYRSTPHHLALRMLRSLDNRIAVLCRDPISLARVRSMTHLNAIQVADLAFLLVPDEDHPRVVALGKWITSKKQSGGRILGINCNRQALGGPGKTGHRSIVDAYAQAMKKMAENHPEVCFVLVPHDSRGEFSDERLGRSISEVLGSELKDRTYLIPDVWSAPEIKAAASKLDCAITGRMHFAIACLGSGTPVASFEYQDKFAGMYELFGLRGLCIPGEYSSKPESVLALLENVYARADTLRSEIAGKSPEIKELSHRNILALLGAQISFGG